MAPWLLVHFLIGLGGTWIARRYAVGRNLLDQPDERRNHAQPTPRGGGIAIVLALVAAGAWLLLRSLAPLPQLGTFLAGLSLVAGVGLLDDHRPLSPWARIVVHALAAVLLAIGAWLATGDVVLAVVAFALAMTLTNIWNFMDGIDGLAASQAALVAVAVASASLGPWQALALALVAAIAGFFPFNFPKARIFLGDVGSGALGFALAALVVGAMGQGPRHAWALWALPLSAFLLDAGLTLLGRLRRGERWWQPHTLHAYQRWVRQCGSHVRVTMAYAAWTVAAIVLMAVLRGRGAGVMFASTGAWYILGIGVWCLLQRKRIAVAVENME